MLHWLRNQSNRPARLSHDRFKSGTATLRWFMPVAKEARESVVKLQLSGETVALGTIIHTSGLAITKASEIKEGKLRCTLANGQQADADLLAVDDENDVALVKVNAAGLKPIQWATGDVSVGQWVVTPVQNDPGSHRHHQRAAAEHIA